MTQQQEELRTQVRQLWQREEIQRARNGEQAMAVANLFGTCGFEGEHLPFPKRLEIALEEQPVQDKQTRWFRKLLLTCFLGCEGLPKAFPLCLELLTELAQLEAWTKTFDISWYGRGNGLCGEARVTDSLLHAAYWIRTFDRQGHAHVEGDRTFLAAFAAWIRSLQATFQDEHVQFLANREANLIEHALTTLETLEREDPIRYAYGPRTDHQQNVFELVLSFSRIAAELNPGYWVTLALWSSAYLSAHERPLSWNDLKTP